MSKNDRIRDLLEEFADRLAEEVHAQALEAVQEALGRQGMANGAAVQRSGASASRGRKKAGRRRASVGSVSEGQLLAAIRQHNGERTEVIAKSLGVSSKEFKPLLDGLVAAGTVSRKGKARGTTLHLGKSSASPKRAKTARKKKAARKATRKSTIRRRANKQSARRKGK